MADFEYRQKTFAQDDIAGMTDALHEDGFALIPGVLSPDEVKRTRDAIDNLTGFGWDKHLSGPTDHYKNVFNRDKWFLDLCDREPLIDLDTGKYEVSVKGKALQFEAVMPTLSGRVATRPRR